ncbi:hypothetical protein [Streptomyces cyaneofuscatus]|uniref:hypothetical protein n=1 Tax=Streptomyces cyaneofuscatus TaxID=66883 RepID=UPI00365AB9C6
MRRIRSWTRAENNQMKSADDADQEGVHIVVVDINGPESRRLQDRNKGCVHATINEAIVLKSVCLISFFLGALYRGAGEVMRNAPPDENSALKTFTWIDRKQDATRVLLALTLLMHRESGCLQGIADSAGQLLPGTQLIFVRSLYHHSSL